MAKVNSRSQLAKVTKPKLRAKIKQSMILQLKDSGAYTDHFMDLVDDYLSFFDIKNRLIRDIRLRGVAVEWKNSPSQHGFKKNDSVSELVKVNAQMLKILQQLNMSVEETAPEGDDDEDGGF